MNKLFKLTNRPALLLLAIAAICVATTSLAGTTQKNNRAETQQQSEQASTRVDQVKPKNAKEGGSNTKSVAELRKKTGKRQAERGEKRADEGSNAKGGSKRLAPLRYQLKAQDTDWRGTGRNHREALDAAFKKTGQKKSEFEVTQWGRDSYGKTFPVEYRHKSGAEVNIDAAHLHNGPDAPHVGWQTGGKRRQGGGVRGHIILDRVPYHRPIVR